MAEKKHRVLYQGESLSYRLREPEFVFPRGELCYPPAAVVEAVRNEPGFVIEEIVEPDEPAVEPKKGKV